MPDARVHHANARKHVKLILPLSHVTLQQARAARATHALARTVPDFDFGLTRPLYMIDLHTTLGCRSLTFTSGPLLSSQRRVLTSAALRCAESGSPPILFLFFLEPAWSALSIYYTYDTNTGQRTRTPNNFQPPWSLCDNAALFVLLHEPPRSLRDESAIYFLSTPAAHGIRIRVTTSPRGARHHPPG